MNLGSSVVARSARLLPGSSPARRHKARNTVRGHCGRIRDERCAEHGNAQGAMTHSKWCFFLSYCFGFDFLIFRFGFLLICFQHLD